MAKFVFAYTGGTAPQTAEEGEAVMAAWIGWFNDMGPAVIDGGNPFGDAKSVAADKTVSAGGTTSLGGYSIVDAADLDAAVELAKGCPVLTAGGTVDVYSTMDM